LTVSEVTTIFIKSLLQSAEDFLGKKVDGAVISVPAWFDDTQRTALSKAAEDAGVKVLQLLEEAGAVAVATSNQATELAPDRTQLIVDLGSSSLELSLLSMRQGLAYTLATASDPAVGGDQIDAKLIKFFAKEFTKKTKTPLTVAPAKDTLDKRAEAKFLLAVEHTKRTLSASPGAATCSVESLKDGLDFTGSINRMRFDLEVRAIYNQVYDKVKELVEGAGLDLYDVDEIVYVGGSACLPGLDETLAQGFTESVFTPFTAGTIVGGGIGDPTTILARGCALQAQLLASLGDEDAEVKKAFEKGSERLDVKATSKTIGVLFPENTSEGLGGQWIAMLSKETAVPSRRTASFEVDLGQSDSKKVAFEIWEVKEGIKIDKIKPPKIELEDDEEPEEEEEEDIEVKEKTVKKEAVLGSISLDAQAAVKEKGRWKTKLELQFVVNLDGAVEIGVWEVGKRSDKVSTTLSAP
jgi:molecular chaperone DnaK (HSP70)